MAFSNVRGQTEEVELVGYKNDRETKRSLLQQVITVRGPNGSVSDTRYSEVSSGVYDVRATKKSEVDCFNPGIVGHALLP